MKKSKVQLNLYFLKNIYKNFIIIILIKINSKLMYKMPQSFKNKNV